MGLFAFMWSMRKGLLVETPGAASAIFTPGEIGQADDPTLTAHDRKRQKKATKAAQQGFAIAKLGQFRKSRSLAR